MNPTTATASSALRTSGDRSSSLQLAQSVSDVVRVVRRALSRTDTLGKCALFLVSDHGEVDLVETVDGPLAADLAAPVIELLGIARRAVRESSTVQMKGVSAGLLWATPLKFQNQIVGVVAAIGEPGDMPEFLDQAGLALWRERTREADCADEESHAVRVDDLERAVSILDEITHSGGTDEVMERIVGAIGDVAGVSEAALWAIRPTDGVYERWSATTDEPGEEDLPPEATSLRGLRPWLAARPRWNGFVWVAAGTIERPRPAAGDTLLLPIDSFDREVLPGLFVLRLENALSDEIVEDLKRWGSLARIAFVHRTDVRRFLRELDQFDEGGPHRELHELKSQFIAAVSHELRTPLTSISAYAETLRSDESAIDDATRDRFLSVIHDESRRLSRVVDDILELATMDSGHVRMSCRPMELFQVVQGALDIVRPLAHERGIALHAPSEEHPQIHADPDLIKQLIVNLLENAIKFTPESGDIGVTILEEDGTVRLEVQDSGPGIPSDQLDAIFERFYQVDGSDARRHGGTGLGLSICKSIVTWHDGRIWAESKVGAGARFVVSLPKSRASSRDRLEAGTTTNASEHRIPELLAEMVGEMMRAETVSLMLLDAGGREMFVNAALGLSDEAIRDAKVAIGEGIAGEVVRTGEAVLISDLSQNAQFSQSNHRDYRTRSLISVPIKLKGKSIGVVNVTNKRSGAPFDQHDLLLLEMLSQRIALVISKIRSFGESRGTVDRVEEALRSVVETHRHYYPSSERYSELLLALCRSLGLNSEETARVHYAAHLRDVGMSRVSEGIYRKPADLTPEERDLVAQHPEDSAKILRSIEFLPDVFDIILHHHETPSGTGYPKGVDESAIPMGARILAVLDAYESLLSERPYRSRLDATGAIEEIRRNVGTQFDATVVEALVQVLRDLGVVALDAPILENREPDPSNRGES